MAAGYIYIYICIKRIWLENEAALNFRVPDVSRSRILVDCDAVLTHRIWVESLVEFRLV